MPEEWIPIEKLPHYEVNPLGEIRNAKTQELRKSSISDAGFPCVLLYGADGRSRYFKQINQLVAKAFLDPPFYKSDTSVWHLDGDLLNCRADNLKWEMRARVLAWNEMHRIGRPTMNTPRVMATRTGVIYENAYECALAVGDLETSIVLKVEKGSPRYRYVGDNDYV